MKSARWKVGIDLAPAARRAQAPGTARLVEEQARALFKLDVPWTWVPVFSKAENPLWAETQSLHPIRGRQTKASLHASLELGRIWRESHCDLGFATAFFTPLIGPPVVANYFDSNFFEPVDTWHRKKRIAQHLLTRSLLSHSLRRARKLFILSEYGRSRMSTIFPKTQDKFIVTPCGIRQPGSPSSEPPAWAPHDARPFYLYVGSFSDNKNQRAALQAWHILQTKYPDAPGLIMIGPGRAAYLQDVIQPLHQALPRPHEVVIPGFTREDHLNWAYWNAQGYLQPSFAEGFGMPVLEAMSCNLPVACSDSTSLPEVAGDAALLFDPRNPSSIAGRVEELWKNASLRARLIELGRNRAAQFTWEKNAIIVADAILAQLTSRA
ncbi:MAG: glycosyltransferase family 4 protein [Kiritimatiellae bacterium]|nr:glycosyltransferase family 4 protein [Kiritimatiellia bacterium]